MKDFNYIQLFSKLSVRRRNKSLYNILIQGIFNINYLKSVIFVPSRTFLTFFSFKNADFYTKTLEKFLTPVILF